MVEKDEVKITDKLGRILKQERIKADLTREVVAERADIGVRHLTAIENEERMPSIETFCRIIRAMGISADCVVYPETILSESDETQLIRLIRSCDERDRKAVKAMVEALCFSRTSEKQK